MKTFKQFQEEFCCEECDDSHYGIVEEEFEVTGNEQYEDWGELDEGEGIVTPRKTRASFLPPAPGTYAADLAAGKYAKYGFTKSGKETAAAKREKISKQSVAEARVTQLPTQGADYSKYDTDHLKMLLRPGILHRNEARFKALIRKELQKREQQSQQSVAEGSLHEMDNRTQSSDRREQRYYSSEEKAKREKEQQKRLKNLSPEMRKKLRLPEPKEEVTEEADKSRVKLGKPFLTPGGPKKRAVYVKNDRGNVVKVSFGDPNLEIKRDNPERRKNFRARHNCDQPGPRWKAKYWSCKYWSKTPVSKLD
jgi:hypothetical protein